VLGLNSFLRSQSDALRREAEFQNRHETPETGTI